MLFLRRLLLTVVVAVLLSGAALGVGWANRSAEAPRPGPATDQPVARDDAPARPAETPAPPAAPDPATPTAPTRTPEPDQPPQPPVLQPGPRLLGSGDEGDRVRDLQARLRQIDWFEGDVTGFYGDVTVAAVRGFQAKREIPVTGEVDRRTLERLHGMTSAPTKAELANQLGGNTPGALDERCRTGRVLCVDKSSSTLRWVVDGQVVKTLDARFGGSATPTREGLFHVTYKNRDHVSSLYGSSMPFAMFFSHGQAVHYSSDFAAVGYNGASHGCVNIRDHDGIAWLFDQVQVGDKVVVYWS